MTTGTTAIWAISGLATAGVIGRPMRWPEWIWAVSGAALLVLLGLVSLGSAGHAVLKGSDVYLFLTGMMLLSETARANGVFDWVAATAVNGARGSTTRLFLLVYGVGVVVTTFLSNDATAVVLTPAVFAVARKAEAEPLPLLLACALIANAASFVLPISNPANLVLYGGHMPPLGQWLASFGLPAIASIGTTLLFLWLMERRRLGGDCTRSIESQSLSRGGMLALGGIVLTAVLLIVMSALDLPLGLPTALAGIATALGVSLFARQSPLKLVRDVSWGVLPLVAGLFVLVQALEQTGVIGQLAALLKSMTDPREAAGVSGTVLAFGSNLVNNLPAGLVASEVVKQAHPPGLVVDGLLIGVDLGPNLSVTGSLATILWLQAIRREGEDVGFWRFLLVGIVVMPTALAAALGVRLLLG
ncbi:SLC13 family permease [Acetobacteraceae bacterium KSS8]|uniref:SLC13 family permease n=1 Tax=Endosaccharibacter trunci TaxID=2812733 RepID=A0ABT1W6P0_9PROT|nr:SLC13 family permease [Acetobacteraceae bacterium KSS8]